MIRIDKQPMKNLNYLTVIGIAVMMLLSSCSKQIEQPFEVYILSADREFPVETRMILNGNYIGDVQRVDKDQLIAISELQPGLKTQLSRITLKAIENSGKELSNITFSLLPDGTYKKVSSTGTMNYQLKTIDKFKFAILFDKP